MLGQTSCLPHQHQDASAQRVLFAEAGCIPPDQLPPALQICQFLMHRSGADCISEAHLVLWSRHLPGTRGIALYIHDVMGQGQIYAICAGTTHRLRRMHLRLLSEQLEALTLSVDQLACMRMPLHDHNTASLHACSAARLSQEDPH